MPDEARKTSQRPRNIASKSRTEFRQSEAPSFALDEEANAAQSS